MARDKAQRRKTPNPVGLAGVDCLESIEEPHLQDYIAGVSEYVRNEASLTKGGKKAAQIRLSAALGRILVIDLGKLIPLLRQAHAGERKVAGALRTAKADVSESHELDGLRLAVEMKPVNLAVGRAIWNRFGDIRTFAVNIHLKFPFAVVGGVLVIPTYEATRKGKKSTTGLIERAVERLRRAGGRKTEGDAPHLLEAIAVIAYDPDTEAVDTSLPPPGSGLRWEEFVASLATTYQARFEE